MIRRVVVGIIMNCLTAASGRSWPSRAGKDRMGREDVIAATRGQAAMYPRALWCRRRDRHERRFGCRWGHMATPRRRDRGAPGDVGSTKSHGLRTAWARPHRGPSAPVGGRTVMVHWARTGQTSTSGGEGTRTPGLLRARGGALPAELHPQRIPHRSSHSRRSAGARRALGSGSELACAGRPVARLGRPAHDY